MNQHKWRVMHFSKTTTTAAQIAMLLAGPALVMGGPLVLVADLTEDFRAHVMADGVSSDDNPVLSDDGGNWRFYSSSTESPTSPGASIWPLTPGNYRGPVYNDATQQNTFPAIGNHNIIPGHGGYTMNSEHLGFHPGHHSSARQYLAIEWRRGLDLSSFLTMHLEVDSLGNNCGNGVSATVFAGSGQLIMARRNIGAQGILEVEVQFEAILGDQGIWIMLGNRGEWSCDQSSIAARLAPAIPCNAADLTLPIGLLDLADINAFTSGFLAQDPIADLNDDGLFDLQDISQFATAFAGGCN